MSSLRAAGVHPEHPFFAEADTARVHIEPLSQVLLSSSLQDDNNYDYDDEEDNVGCSVVYGVFSASDENDAGRVGTT